MKLTKLTIYIWQLLFVVSIVLFAPIQQINAAGNTECDPAWGDLEVPLPGMSGTVCGNVSGTGTEAFWKYAGYIATLVEAMIVATGLIVVVIAGYVYMTAGGDAGRVGQAKTMIISALLGIALALGSYLILNTIGPQFVGN